MENRDFFSGVGWDVSIFRKMKGKIAIGAGVVVVFLFYQMASRPRGSAAEMIVDAGKEPAQVMLPENAEPIEITDSGYHFQITPKAEYTISARVLSTERYRTGWQSHLSPVDLALGWNEMSDPNVDEWLSWSQSGRWYFYRWSGDSPYQGDRIRDQSANVHIIPSNKNLERAVLSIDRNDMIALEGLLVNVDGKKDSSTYWWNTSLSRTDSGDGSCELLYVQSLTVDGKTFR